MILYERDIKRVEAIRNYIIDHLGQELDRRQLSSLFCISSATLDRHFYYCYKITLSRFVRMQRMEKAYLLLQARQLNISEISETVGFKDVSNFSHAFHTYFGKSPFTFMKDNVVGGQPNQIPGD